MRKSISAEFNFGLNLAFKIHISTSQVKIRENLFLNSYFFVVLTIYLSYKVMWIVLLLSCPRKNIEKIVIVPRINFQT